MSSVNRRKKLSDLARIEGKTVDELLESGTFDSVCPAICMRPDCDYTTTMEPDQTAGYCELCGTNTVSSALVLAGLL